MSETVVSGAAAPHETSKKRSNDEIDEDLSVAIDEPATKRAAHANGVTANGVDSAANGSASADDDSGSYSYSYSYSVSADEAGKKSDEAAVVHEPAAEMKVDAGDQNGASASGSYSYSYSYSYSGSSSDDEEDGDEEEKSAGAPSAARAKRLRRQPKPVDRYRDEDFSDEEEGNGGDDNPYKKPKAPKNQKTLADANGSNGLCTEDDTFVVYARPVAVDQDRNLKPRGLVCGIVTFVHVIKDTHMYATADVVFQQPDVHCCDTPKYTAAYVNRAERIAFRHRAQDTDVDRKVSRLELLVTIRGSNDEENRLLAERASPFCIFALRVRMLDDHIGWDGLPAASLAPYYNIRHIRLPYGIPLGLTESKRYTLENRAASKERTKKNICLAGMPVPENAAFDLTFVAFERMNWIDDPLRVLRLGTLSPIYVRMPSHAARTTGVRPHKRENYCEEPQTLEISAVDVRFGLVCGGVAVDRTPVTEERLTAAIGEFVKIQSSSGDHACVDWTSKIRDGTSILPRLLSWTTAAVKGLTDLQRPVVQRPARLDNAMKLISWRNECCQVLDEQHQAPFRVAPHEPSSCLGRALLAPMMDERFWTLESYIGFSRALLLSKDTEFALWAEKAILSGSAYAIFLHAKFQRIDPRHESLRKNHALVRRLISEKMLAQYSNRTPRDLTERPIAGDLSQMAINITSVDYYRAGVSLFVGDSEMQKVASKKAEALLDLAELVAALHGDGAPLCTEPVSDERAAQIKEFCAHEDKHSPVTVAPGNRICYTETAHTMALMSAFVQRQPPHIILRDEVDAAYGQWAARVLDRCSFGASVIVVAANQADINSCNRALEKAAKGESVASLDINYLPAAAFVNIPIDQMPANPKAFVTVPRADLFDGELLAGLLAVLARVANRNPGTTFDNCFGDVDLIRGVELPPPPMGAPPLLCAVRYGETHRAGGGALLETFAEKHAQVDSPTPLRIEKIARFLEEGVDMFFDAHDQAPLARRMFSIAPDCVVLRSEHGAPNSTGVALTVLGMSVSRARSQRLDSHMAWQPVTPLAQDSPPKHLCIAPCSRFNPLWIPCMHAPQNEWTAEERVRLATRIALRCALQRSLLGETTTGRTQVHFVYSRDHFEKAIDEADGTIELRRVIGGAYPPVGDADAWIKGEF